VFTGVTAAASCLPLVFHKPTVLWFNNEFVHEELPEGGADALETIWQVRMRAFAGSATL
jgi:hypothetical protein